MGFQPPVAVEKALRQVHNRNYFLPAIQREFVWGTEQVRKPSRAASFDFPGADPSTHRMLPFPQRLG
jgi:hypothetical protein